MVLARNMRLVLVENVALSQNYALTWKLYVSLVITIGSGGVFFNYHNSFISQCDLCTYK